MKEETKTLIDKLVDLLKRDQDYDSYTPPEELAKEVMTLLRPDVTNESVFCPACEGAGVMAMKAFPSGKEVTVLCPVCYGSKFIYMSQSNSGNETSDPLSSGVNEKAVTQTNCENNIKEGRGNE